MRFEMVHTFMPHGVEQRLGTIDVQANYGLAGVFQDLVRAGSAVSSPIDRNDDCVDMESNAFFSTLVK